MPRYVNPIAAQAQAPQAQVLQPQAPRMQQQGYPAPAPAMGTSPYPTVSVGRVPHTAPFTPNYASVAPQPPVNFHHHAVHAPPPRAPKTQPKKPRSPPAAAPTPATPSVPSSSFLERAVVPSSGLGAVAGASASALPATRLQLTKKGKKDVVDQHAVSFAADAAVAYAQYPLESVAAARYEACITAHRLEREAVAARKAAANSTTEVDAEIVADDDGAGEVEKPVVFVGQLPYSTPLEIIAFVIDVLASEDPAAFAADPSSALAAAPTSVVSIHRSGRNGARVTVTSHAVVDRLMARARTAYPDVHGLWVAQDQAPMMAHDARIEAKELKVDANVVARHPLNFERPRTSIPAANAATTAAVATSTPVDVTTPVTAEPIAPAAPTPRAVPAASASVGPAGLGQKQASIETVGSLASAPEPQPASLLPTAVATPPSLPVFHAPLPMLAVTQPSGSYVLVPQAPHGAAPLWLSASGSASVSMSGPGSPLSMSNATGGVASTTASPYAASSPFIVPATAVAAGQHLSGANNAQPQPQQPQLSQPMAAMTHGFAPAGHPAFLQQPPQFANVAVGAGVSVGAPAAVPTMAWQQGAPLPPPPPHSAVTAMTSESDASSVRGPRGGADVSVIASRSSSTTASSDAAWDAFLERNGGAVRSDLFAHSRSTTTATSVDNGAALEFRTLTHDDITTTAADAASSSSAENMDGAIKATKTAALLDPAAWSLSWQPRTSPSTNAATPSTTPASMSRVETSTW